MNIGVVVDAQAKEIIFEQAGVSNKTIGYYFRPVLPREIYTATEDCLMISKEDYQRIGGFDFALANQLQGIDLSLKVQNLGKKVIFTPYATLVEQTNINRQIERKAKENFIDTHQSQILADYYQNPNNLG